MLYPLKPTYFSISSTQRGVDSEIVMRGHGLYICVALNIPCLALSTQDKVSHGELTTQLLFLFVLF